MDVWYRTLCVFKQQVRFQREVNVFVVAFIFKYEFSKKSYFSAWLEVGQRKNGGYEIITYVL